MYESNIRTGCCDVTRLWKRCYVCLDNVSVSCACCDWQVPGLPGCPPLSGGILFESCQVSLAVPHYSVVLCLTGARFAWLSPLFGCTVFDRCQVCLAVPTIRLCCVDRCQVCLAVPTIRLCCVDRCQVCLAVPHYSVVLCLTGARFAWLSPLFGCTVFDRCQVCLAVPTIRLCCVDRCQVCLAVPTIRLCCV